MAKAAQVGELSCKDLDCEKVEWEYRTAIEAISRGSEPKNISLASWIGVRFPQYCLGFTISDDDLVIFDGNNATIHQTIRDRDRCCFICGNRAHRPCSNMEVLFTATCVNLPISSSVDKWSFAISRPSI